MRWIKQSLRSAMAINPINTELNPICHLLALLGAHHILHFSRIRVNNRTLVDWNIHLCDCRKNISWFQYILRAFSVVFVGLKTFVAHSKEIITFHNGDVCVWNNRVTLCYLTTVACHFPSTCWTYKTLTCIQQSFCGSKGNISSTCFKYGE